MAQYRIVKVPCHAMKPDGYVYQLSHYDKNTQSWKIPEGQWYFSLRAARKGIQRRNTMNYQEATENVSIPKEPWEMTAKEFQAEYHFAIIGSKEKGARIEWVQT